MDLQGHHPHNGTAQSRIFSACARGGFCGGAGANTAPVKPKMVPFAPPDCPSEKWKCRTLAMRGMTRHWDPGHNLGTTWQLKCRTVCRTLGITGGDQALGTTRHCNPKGFRWWPPNLRWAVRREAALGLADDGDGHVEVAAHLGGVRPRKRQHLRVLQTMQCVSRVGNTPRERTLGKQTRNSKSKLGTRKTNSELESCLPWNANSKKHLGTSCSSQMLPGCAPLRTA